MSFGPVHLERDGEVAVAIIDNPPVNALSAAVRDGLRDAVLAAGRDPAVAALVLIGAGGTFVAGGDIAALGTRPGGTPMRDLNRLIEASAKPIVAALQGAALGGGLELTLAAHARIAAASTQLGLPEVKLGIIPGAGGTQRLPRLVGFEQALDLVAFGATIEADQALAIGLVDGVVAAAELRTAAIALARRLAADRALPVVRDRVEEIRRVRADPRVFYAFAERHAQRLRHEEAPAAALRAVRAAADLAFEDGLTFERGLFEGLVHTDQSKALRHLFFAERAAWKIPGMARESVAPAIRSVCILRSNRDGVAAGRAFRAAGLDVAFWDEAPLSAGQADLVFDPTFMALDAHRELIALAAPSLRPGAILSTMAAGGVADLVPASATLGIHFLYPADEKKFVELIRPAALSPTVLLSVLRLLKRMQKVAVLAAPTPSPSPAPAPSYSIATRLMAARQRAAEALVAHNQATPWDIDRELAGFGFAEGVFAWQDRIGLETAWLRSGAPGDALRARLCAAGRTGQAVGAGFHNHAEGAPRRSADAERLLDLTDTPPMANASLLAALLLPIANEGLELLRRGTALRASDIDLVAVTAHGWPAWRGGPLFYLEQIFGPALALSWLERLEARFGETYRPSPLLRELAAGQFELKQWEAA